MALVDSVVHEAASEPAAENELELVSAPEAAANEDLELIVRVGLLEDAVERSRSEVAQMRRFFEMIKIAGALVSTPNLLCADDE